MWRGDGRLGLSVAAPFVWRCPSNVAIAPFPRAVLTAGRDKAKAMAEDRQKCISAGASDYITKPVDKDQLMSLLRVWLYDRN